MISHNTFSVSEWIPNTTRVQRSVYHIMDKDGNIYLGMVKNGTVWDVYISRNSRGVKIPNSLLATSPDKAGRLTDRIKAVLDKDIRYIWLLSDEEIKDNGIQNMPLIRQRGF